MRLGGSWAVRAGDTLLCGSESHAICEGGNVATQSLVPMMVLGFIEYSLATRHRISLNLSLDGMLRYIHLFKVSCL